MIITIKVNKKHMKNKNYYDNYHCPIHCALEKYMNSGFSVTGDDIRINYNHFNFLLINGVKIEAIKNHEVNYIERCQPFTLTLNIPEKYLTKKAIEKFSKIKNIY